MRVKCILGVIAAFAASGGVSLALQMEDPAGDRAAALERERLLNPDPPEGAALLAMNVGILARTYYLVDARPDKTEPAPVVFVLHGGGRHDARATFRFGFQDFAKRSGYVTVHPNGLGNRWADGRMATDPGVDNGLSPEEEVAFFGAMIDLLIARGVADPDRVYVTGGSNGGAMTLLLACRMADRLAAVAPWIASLPAGFQNSCAPAAPLPIVMMNGTADPVVPYDGGYVAGAAARGEAAPVEETLDFWRRRNRCGEHPETETLPDADPEDGARIEKYTWTSCANDSDVVFYKVIGGGHHIPGDPYTGGGPVGRDLDGAEAIWAFLLAHTR